MKKIDLLKELLRINIDKLGGILGMKIEFEHNKFFVKIKNIKIFEDEILNYDLDFEDQKRFIFNVGNNIYRFFEDEWSLMNYELLNIKSNKNLLLIVGDIHHYILKNYVIEIDKEKIKKCKNINSNEEFENCLKKILKQIAFNLDWEKVNVVYDLKEERLYINNVIYQRKINITYINSEDFKVLQINANSILNVITTDDISICYSEVDEKEARKAFEYIKKLLYS